MDKSFEYYNKEMINDRNIDEFIGLCKGVLADNEFNELEKKFLLNWLNSNDLFKHVIVEQIYNELNNNKNLDELKNMLILFTGGNTPSIEINSMSTALPIEKMLRTIKFENTIFCLTGKFSSAYGNRKAIEEIIIDKKGICKNRLTLDVDYLVIGELGNNDWKHSTLGRKIETALTYKKESKSNIKIISESQLLVDL